MAPPGAGVRPEEKQRRCHVVTHSNSTSYFDDCGSTNTPLRRLCVSLDTEAAHDFEETCVVGEAQLFGCLRHMPLIPLERLDDDLAFGLLLLLLEGARCAVRGARDGASMITDLRGHRSLRQLVPVAGDEHALHDIPELPDIVPPP